MRSVYDAIKSLISVVPKTVTATETGSAVDTLGYSSAELVLSLGAIDATTGDESYVLSITECATSGGAYTATGITCPTIVNSTGGSTNYAVRVEDLGRTRLRFLKAVLTLGGTTPSAAMSANFLLGRAFQEPVQT